MTSAFDPHWMTRSDAAETLEVTTRTVDRYIAEARLVSCRTLSVPTKDTAKRGPRVWVSRASVTALKRSLTPPPPPNVPA